MKTSPSPDAHSLTPNRQCSLIKLGGSLLTMTGLRDRLSGNLSNLARRPILLVGGGGLADVVREWDSVHQLPTSDSDSLATMTLSITAEFVGKLLPGGCVVAHLGAAIEVLAGGGIPIVDVPRAMEALGSQRLPQGWHVTSDSLAAILASDWRLDGLILVKSAACPTGMTCEAAADCGLVDAYFPKAVKGRLRVRWCDGREESWQAEDWLGS